MFLGFTDGRETMFLALILKAVQEGKEIPKFLEDYVHPDWIEGLVAEIQNFARSKLEHPILKLYTEDMAEFLSIIQERKEG